MAQLTKGLRPHDHLVALLVIAAVLSLAFFEVIYGGRTLLSGNVTGVMGFEPPYGYSGAIPGDGFHLDPGASAWQVEPLTRKIGAAYKQGHLPLWNPNEGTGDPLLANLPTAAFNPLRLPVFLSSNPIMWDLYLVGRFLLGGLMAYLFARLLGMGLPGSLVTAVGYILSGHFLLYGNEWWLDVYFALPLVLYGVEGIIRRASPVAVALLAAATAFDLLGGMPEASFFTLVLAGGYAAYRLLAVALRERDLRSLARRSLIVAAGFLAGIALAAPVLLPFAEYTRSAFTPHTAASRIGLQHDLPRFAISLLVPYFNGGPYDAIGGGWSGIRNYVGVALPFLAVLGLWHQSITRRAGWFFLAAALLGVAKVYGVAIVSNVGRLPLANLAGFPQYSAPVIAFCVAFLAGAGTDRLYRREKLAWSPHVALAVVLGAFLYLLYLNHDLWHRLPHRSYLSLTLAGGVLLMTWAVAWVSENVNSKGLSWACLGIVAGELLLFTPHGVYRNRYDTFAEPPYVNFLQVRGATEGRSRVLGLDALLMPDDGSAYGLDDIRSLNALYPKRYLSYVKAFISPLALDRFVGGPVSSLEGPPLFQDNPMLDLMGVDYILTRGSLASPLINQIINRLPASPSLQSRSFKINGAMKPVLFAAPAPNAPLDVPFDLEVRPDSEVLRFSAAIDPVAWQGPGDGVLFRVTLQPAGADASTLWEQWIDPKSNPADRHWFDQDLDLSRYEGQKVTIHLITFPGANNAADYSGWGDLRLTGQTEEIRSQFQLAYDNEIQIYRNSRAFPRAFAVHRINEVADQDAALKRMQQNDFDPARVAVLESKPGEHLTELLAATPESDRSSVALSRYQDNRVVLNATMEHAGLVVLTDTYYPGWKAFVDGKRVKLYAADYLFRGVIVPEGEHEITFEYNPASFSIGLAIGGATLLLLLGWWGFSAWSAGRRPVSDRMPKEFSD